MDMMLGSIEVCPILICITLFTFHAHTIRIQYNWLFQKRNIEVEDMGFPELREVKIHGISRNELEKGWNPRR